MANADVRQALGATTYPGRGILLGQSADGRKAVIVYFIMGRSENSRNRVFVPDGDGLKTKAYDESKMVDPSLIIYAPVKKADAQTTIVTNGDQTDTIATYMAAGKTFEDALRTRQAEPDAPNYTPRISGIVCADFARQAFTYKLSILKSNQGDPASDLRFFYEYVPVAGQGHFIHTYAGDGNPLPSFEGEPTPVALEGDIDALTALAWDSLHAENRVALFTRYIDLSTGAEETRIVNKHEGN